MCQNVSIALKAQACHGFLPQNWVFFFDEVQENPTAAGLFVFKRGTRHYKSFEQAAADFPTEFSGREAKTFYDEVGLEDVKPMFGTTTTTEALRDEAGGDQCSFFSSLESDEEAANKQNADFLQPDTSSLHSEFENSNLETFMSQKAAKRRKLDREEEVQESTLKPPAVSSNRSRRQGRWIYKGSNILAELDRRKCGECPFCKDDVCGSCESCRMNSSRTRPYRDACVKRVSRVLYYVIRKRESNIFELDLPQHS
jgi:hypothetical protein